MPKFTTNCEGCGVKMGMPHSSACKLKPGPIAKMKGCAGCERNDKRHMRDCPHWVDGRLGNKHAGQWKPGQSGNIKGRPPGKSFSSLLKEVSDEIHATMGKTKRELICEKVVKAAVDGDKWAIQFLMERVEGKPHQAIKVEEENNPFAGLTEEQMQEAKEALAQLMVKKGGQDDAPVDSDA